MGPDVPSGHTYLDFNAPLSDARASELVGSLQPLAGARVVDFGCGWAELLLRLVEAEPAARGIGVDTDTVALARGRANAAARGLDARVRLVEADVTEWHGDPPDVAIAIGSSHAWGGTRAALEAMRAQLRPGGRLLFGDGIWEQPPSEDALSALGATADEFRSVAALVDLAMVCGFRILALSVANGDEWDSFESRWCAGRERWLLAHPDAPDAEAVREMLDEHRHGWLHGYRRVLGFAYLTLALP
ncbi:MAG: Methyltransferase type 12 [Actinomycetia bacterium]|nr:Methyltransferase type 12 [Actinomycetes bacterium]